MKGGQSKTKALLDGERSVYRLSHVTILQNLEWNDFKKKWTIFCCIRIESSNPELVPNETFWYVIIDRAYPLGDIKFYPSIKKGLTRTFHHQIYNGISKDNLLWRSGDICVKTSLYKLGRSSYSEEPYEANKRLKWHFMRALDWLEHAANGTLVEIGNYFEIPDYPTGPEPFTIVISESRNTFAKVWENSNTDCGILELTSLKKPVSKLIVKRIMTFNHEELLNPEWGEFINNSMKDTIIGIWMIFERPIVLPPWQAPRTWKELIDAAKTQGKDIRRLIGSVSRKIRDGTQHIALLGFPIPDKIGSKPMQLYWQALLLPVLSQKNVYAPGFRPNELGYKMRDRKLLSGSEPVDWQKSENWNSDEIACRGRYSSELTTSRVVIIGAGSLGSMVSELLVRGSVHQLTIVDKDTLEAGNLVRHTLGLEDVGLAKATGLKTHLMKILPYAKVKEIAYNLEDVDDNDKEMLREADIIIDCTASDEVIHYCGGFVWGEEKLFCSVSVGFKAKRLYVFMARKKAFPNIIFLDLMKEWLEKEIDDMGDSELPRTGIGCWHPAFPARVDDMWMAASTALKYFDEHMKIQHDSTKFAVFEQIRENEKFCGIKLIFEK